MPSGDAQGRISEPAASGAGTRQALLPQHPRRVQTFDNDAAVSFGQSRGQHMQMVGTDIVDPAMQPGQFNGAFPVASGTFHTARAGTRNMSQLAQRCFQRARVLDTFDHRAGSGGHGRQPPYPDINTNPRIRPRHVGLLGPLNQNPHTRIQPGAVAAHRDRQHPRPAFRDEPEIPMCFVSMGFWSGSGGST
jgi:hypothetical protein